MTLKSQLKSMSYDRNTVVGIYIIYLNRGILLQYNNMRMPATNRLCIVSVCFYDSLEKIRSFLEYVPIQLDKAIILSVVFL